MTVATLRRRLDRLDGRPRQGRLTKAEAAELAQLEAAEAERRAVPIDQLTDAQLDELLFSLSAGAGPSRLSELRQRALSPAQLAARAREDAEAEARIAAMTEEELDAELERHFAGRRDHEPTARLGAATTSARHNPRSVDHGTDRS